MTDADKRALREFFASPSGRDMIAELNKAFHVPIMSIDDPEAFWRDKDGNRIEAEAASSEPLDPQRPFPRPMPLARPVSVNWFMLAAWLACVLSMGGLLGWIIFATIRRYA
jgi:hypothetical protein